MNFSNALPATTVNTVTTPDGKWTYTLTTTTSTTTTLSVATPDGAMVATDSGKSIFDSLNTWSVVKGVIQFDGAPMAGTNNVAKLVWTKGLMWQENKGGKWWYWDAINQIWVSGAAPV